MRASQLQDTSLRYFYEVAKTGSLASASERLHVAPSAISRQISGLEQVLNLPLFERHPRGMVLNAAGEILAIHARHMQLDAERVINELDALQGLCSGRVRIAASPGLANEFLPPLIINFRNQHPGISFEVEVQMPATISQSLRAGDIDIGLQFSQAPAQDIKVEYRQSAPIHALMRPDHALADSKTVTLAAMKAYPLALPPVSTTIRQAIDLACNHQQLILAPVLTSNNMPTLHSFVVHGGGLSVTGTVSASHLITAGMAVAVPICDRGLDLRSIEVQTLVGRSLPRAVQRFLEQLITALSETEDDSAPSALTI